MCTYALWCAVVTSRCFNMNLQWLGRLFELMAPKFVLGIIVVWVAVVLFEGYKEAKEKRARREQNFKTAKAIHEDLIIDKRLTLLPEEYEKMKSLDYIVDQLEKNLMIGPDDTYSFMTWRQKFGKGLYS